MKTVTTIHEYRGITASLAYITASVSGDRHPDAVLASLSEKLGPGATPVRRSFRSLGDSGVIAGFVHASRAVEAFETAEPDASRFHKVQANLYMDKADEQLWEVRDGAASKYLVRKGQDDLTAMIEKARVSPRGSTPRLSSVVMSSAEQNHLVAFVSAGETTAEMDYGVCLGTTPSGDMTVLSSLQNQAVTVKACMMVGSYELHDIPRVPQDKVNATIQARRNVTAADAMSPKLTPAEYWKLQYSYAPEYLAKVMQQVEETAVA